MNWYGLHVTKPSSVVHDTPLTALAFFLGNPRGWRYTPWDEKVVTTFKETLAACPNLTADQIVPHGNYLIGLGSRDVAKREKSMIRLREELGDCSRLGIKRYVMHPGCAGPTQRQQGLQRLVDGLNEVGAEYQDVHVLVENMTGTRKLCTSFEELAWVTARAPHARVCLDTAHAWGEGLPMDTLLNDFDRVVGLDKLYAMHLNNSKVDAGSHKDRHENILTGKIPVSFFHGMAHDARLENVPCILETPDNCHGDMMELVNKSCIYSV